VRCVCMEADDVPGFWADGADGGWESPGSLRAVFCGAGKEVVAACEMPVPNELEAGLVDEIGVGRETVVAFAVLRGS